MSDKSYYMLAIGIGGTVGGFVPNLWHASWLSPWGIVFSTLGGIAGIWLVYRFIANA